MTLPEDQLRKVRGFPGGVNNVAPSHDIPLGEDGLPRAAREIVNFDLIGPSRKPKLRSGYSPTNITGKTHSPYAHGDHLFMVEDGDLKAYKATGLPLAPTLVSTVRADLGLRTVSYADVHGDLYYSNGKVLRVLRNYGVTDEQAWIGCPGAPFAAPTASPDPGYTLPSGDYAVAITYFDAAGRESAAYGMVPVTLPDGGYGIHLTGFPPAPEGAVKMRAYLSPPNDAILYSCLDMLPSVTSIVLGSPGTDGRELETMLLDPMPPCDTLRFWNGRLLGASGNLLRWSEGGGRIGLTDLPANYMRMGMEITLLEPLGEGSESAGVFVADHKYTYWLAGTKPAEWRRVTRYDYPAVKGTSIQVKGSDIGLETNEIVAAWMAKNGVLVAGLPGGSVVQLTDPDALAMDVGLAGASLFREHSGLRQLISSYISTGGNRLAVGDRVSATVTQHP